MDQSLHSLASRTFALRAESRNTHLTAQTAEHDFYKMVKLKVEEATTQLCDELSKLLQGPLLDWSESKLQAFANSASVDVNHLRQWQAVAKSLNAASNAVDRAKEIRVRAKSSQSKVAGTLWGAKSGFETDYATASMQLKEAETAEASYVSAQKIAHAKAEEFGTRLLELCVSNAAHLAMSTEYGRTIQKILTAVAADAAEALTKHKRDQLNHIRILRQHLDQLQAIYET